MALGKFIEAIEKTRYDGWIRAAKESEEKQKHGDGQKKDIRKLHKELGLIIDNVIGVAAMQEGHGVTFPLGKPDTLGAMSPTLQKFLHLQQDENLSLGVDVYEKKGYRFLDLNVQTKTGVARSIQISTQAGLGYQFLEVSLHRGAFVPESVEEAYKEIKPPFVGSEGLDKGLSIAREMLTLIYQEAPSALAKIIASS